MKTTICAALTALLALSASALAQPPPGPPPGGPPPELVEKFKQVRAQVLRDRVGLPEELAKRVEGVLDEVEAERQRLRKRLHQSKKRLGQLVRRDEASEAEYAAAIDELVAAQKEMLRFREAELDRLRKLLTQRQTARMLVALQRLERKAKRHFREFKRHKRRQHRREMRGQDDPFELDE